MYWWKELLFVSSYKVCFLFQNFVSCSVSYNINWIVTQIGFFPGPHICSKALTGVGRGITSPFHGDFYFNFHLSWLMCKSWMLQRLEKLICLVRSFSMSCDIFDLHICQDRWKLENWCLLLTQVDCRETLWLDWDNCNGLLIVVKVNLEVTVLDYDMLGGSDAIGKVPDHWSLRWAQLPTTN